DIVTIDERVLTPQGWKCRKRTDLKRAVTRDGAPYIADLTDATRPILARIQHRYDSLAIALSSGDAKAAEPLFANGAELHDLSGKPMTGQQWIDAEAHARTLGLRYDLRFAVTGISVSGATAIVTCERTAIRQATDREGVYRTTRETTTLRDTWVAGQAGWVIARSEPLLAEHDGVQPIEAAGWK
ncbi:MAG TPA: DUF4440 domain-containing protein, partial [Chthonomonadaceae bacterium]|nr:DUF4440 domain-containing protein [Chthonomonadaceae bacterium]